MRLTASAICSGLVLMFVPLARAQTSAVPAAAAGADVWVTTSPLPVAPAALGRPARAVTRADLDAAPAGSVPDALDLLTPVTAAPRGGGAVQSDLSLRGSTFQQVLLSLDGRPAADPQTAHHNMDVPLPFLAIDDVSVIPGAGTALFGPTAFAGTVDVTPHRPRESGGRAQAAYGSWDTWRLGAIQDGVRGDLTGSAAFAFDQSGGFATGTDYRAWSSWGRAAWAGEGGGMHAWVGFADRNFGAQDFYGAYPSRERTSTLVADAGPELNLDNGWGIDGAIRYRRHSDEFILFRDDPNRYRNHHTTDVATERVLLTSPDGRTPARLAVGIERTDTAMDSSNMGQRHDWQHALLAQVAVGGSDTPSAGTLGVRLDQHQTWGTEVAPSAGGTLALADPLRVRAAVGRGFRPPSYTERYYTDPRNTGNPDLQPEDAWDMEAGADWDVCPCATLSAGFFRRDARRLIDWVRATDTEPWRAVNIGASTTQGPELAATLRHGAATGRVDYRYLDADAEATGLASKYALNVPRHDVGLAARWHGRGGFSAGAEARYRDVPTLDRYWLVSARVAQRLGPVTLFVAGRNLLDETYAQIPGVPTAGRYAETGVELAW